MTAPAFIPGLKLGELFYQEAVRPILEDRFPGLAHSAALIGSGSEILGFDTEMSADHHWGPRVMLFLREEDHARFAAAITETLHHDLPRVFHGYSTNFSLPDPNDNNVQLLQFAETGPINHRVDVLTVAGFFRSYLSFDLTCEIEPADWLTLPEQILGTVTAGAVYHDEVGLQVARARFAYYPHDVWLYLLAAGWERIGQEEHLMGRAGMVRDELGSALIGARLVRDLMRLCFLMERRYAPYPKWFGTAFNHLSCAADLSPALRGAQMAATWQERERHLVAAYEYVAARQNALGIADAVPASAHNFFGRPFQVISGEQFAGALRARIGDPRVQRIAGKSPIGSIDQFSDSTDLLSDPRWRPVLRKLYE